MSHYLIFILGAFIGMAVTIFVLGLCKAADEADDQDVYASWRRESKRNQDRKG